MGHLINPLSFRLGLTSFWKFNNVNYFIKMRERHLIFFFDNVLYKFLSWYIRSNWYFNFFKIRFRKFRLYRSLRRKRRRSKFPISKIQLFYRWSISLLKQYQNDQSGLDTIFYSRTNLNFGTVINFENNYLADIRFYKDFGFFKDRCFAKFFVFNSTDYFFFFSFLVVNISRSLKKSGKLVWYKKKFFFPDVSHFVIYRSGILSVKVVLYFMHTVFEKTIFRESNRKQVDFLFSYKKNIVKYISLYRSWILFFDSLYYPLFFIFIFFRLFSKLCFFVLLFGSKQVIEFKEIFFFFKDLFFYFLNFFVFYVKVKRLLFLLVKNLIPDIFFSKVYFFFKRFFFSISQVRFIFLFNLRSKIDFLSNFKLFLLERFFAKSIFFYLSDYLNFLFYPLKISICYKLLSSSSVSASLLFLFFVRNLKSRKPINKIVSMVLSDLKKQKGLLGFRILTSGRFTRKERAFYKWISINRVPLSVYNSIVDYYAGVFKSRFGICSLRIWLFKKI